MTRPSLVVGVIGTATEVGKTWVTANLATALGQSGLAVAARKPVQSFDPDEPGPTDAEVLADATGEATADVCPVDHSLPVALAPPMAADALGIPRLSLADLVGAISWPDGVDVGFVETVGGSRSPAASDGDSVALVEAVGCDVLVLVADAGLGTINAVRSARCGMSGPSLMVFLNRFEETDATHQANRTWLETDDQARVHTTIAGLAYALVQMLGAQRA